MHETKKCAYLPQDLYLLVVQCRVHGAQRVHRLYRNESMSNKMLGGLNDRIDLHFVPLQIYF